MASGDRVNVLLVDDQPAKLLAFEVILQGLGENLIKASSAREALDHLLRTDVAVDTGASALSKNRDYLHFRDPSDRCRPLARIRNGSGGLRSGSRHSRGI